jgi:nitrogen fixation/metabolism regulation signal transduction histidine kinase
MPSFGSYFRRQHWGVGPVLLLFAGLLLSLYLLSSATENSATIGPYYSWLLLGNALGLLTLTVILGYQLYRLALEYRRRQAGIRLTLRMVTMFVILAVVPVSLVYILSVQFLQRGIDSWFDVRIETALGNALDLSRDSMTGLIRAKAKTTLGLADSLVDMPTSIATLDLVDMRLSSGADEIALLDTSGRVYAFSNADPDKLLPDAPSELIYSQLRQGYPYLDMEPIKDEGFFIRIVIEIPDTYTYNLGTSEKRLIQALYPVSERLNALSQSVQSAFAAYKELSYIRDDLKYSFILTLSLALVLNILAAVIVAVISARRLVQPVRILVEGTQAVATGDYQKRLPVTTKDELGKLIGSFNEMTQRVAEASQEARQSREAAEEEHAYVQTVLSRLTSGVMTLNADGVIVTMNPMASRILFDNTVDVSRKSLEQMVDQFPSLHEFYNCLNRHLHAGESEWQEQLVFLNHNGRQVLMVNGGLLSPEQGREGEHVVMFDDVTDFVQAQRNAAWGEMARRLAHEIKNPLTPIQLSAERVRHKCLHEIDGKAAEVLDRATHTIIDQVEAMKDMVNAFTQYARSPELKIESLSLNQMIEEIMDMYKGDSQKVTVELRLDHDDTYISADAGRIRQLLHNLIRNAFDALAGSEGARLIIETRLQPENNSLMLIIEDNGPGFAGSVIENVFEPYVTTKQQGTGLGLAIVKKIVEEHHGAIKASNRTGGGARITIHFSCMDMIGKQSVREGAG